MLPTRRCRTATASTHFGFTKIKRAATAPSRSHNTTAPAVRDASVDGAVMMFVSAGTVHRKARQDKMENGLGHRRTVTSLQARARRPTAMGPRAATHGHRLVFLARARGFGAGNDVWGIGIGIGILTFEVICGYIHALGGPGDNSNERSASASCDRRSFPRGLEGRARQPAHRAPAVQTLQLG